MTIVIPRKAGEEDRLFGSVTSADIVDKLQEMGITVDRKTVLLNDPIKTIGERKVQVKAGYQINAEIIVQVVPETIGEEG